MAQYRLNAYDADVWIPEFKGLMQYGDQMGTDLRYSPDCMNVETPAGVLQPTTTLEGPTIGPFHYQPSQQQDPTQVYPRSGTMMWFLDKKVNKSAYYGNVASLTSLGAFYREGYNMFLFAHKQGVSRLPILAEPKTLGSYDLIDVRTIKESEEDGQTVETDVSLKSTEFKWCSYEYTYNDDNYNTVLMASPRDGLYYYDVTNDVMKYIDRPFGDEIYDVARYAERIWVCTRQAIYYSRPYSISDWSQDNDNPSQGGGQINLPTFDDDRILAMVPLGDSLILFSQKRAWRITGTDPSSFVIQEQYGNGTKCPETLAVVNDRIMMVGDDCLQAYDGSAVAKIRFPETNELFRDLKLNIYTPYKATKVGNKYIVSFCPNIPKEGDTASAYKSIVYDLIDETINVINCPNIMSFCGDMPYAWVIDSPSSATPTYRMIKLETDSWHVQRPLASDVSWTSPWITMSRLDVKKGGFELYFTPQVGKRKTLTAQTWQGLVTPIMDREINARTPTNTYSETTGDVTFNITIETEKKAKVKQYTAGYDAKPKTKRIHFGGAGRRFRVKIATNTNIPWRLVGGIHIIAEIDKD